MKMRQTFAHAVAHDAAPDTELCYNDYNLATRPAERAGAVRSITDLQKPRSTKW